MRYCGRQFEEPEIDIIRGMIAGDPCLSRYRLSTMVCERLNWLLADSEFWTNWWDRRLRKRGQLTAGL